MKFAGEWHQAKALFRAALELPSDERASYLTKHCLDETLRDEVLRLLVAQDDAAFLASPIQMPSHRDEVGPDPLIGTRVAEYLILRRIGTGGMGVVYEARQDRPLRTVAVKVLRPGFATQDVLRRFEIESRVLARLQHPGIAHIYASGTGEFGGGPQPWFAMELIDGSPLNIYADSRRLGPRSKLELLASICDAVQHAHQRGVIHRDLKPANILIAEAKDTAEAPQPKILDFGVARLVDSDIQVTLHTAVGELVGTLNYMSPEQLRGRPDEIDARSDVYALGVIAYELLTRSLPYGLRRSGVAEIIQAIEQVQPRRLGAVDASLRGDLETIIAKALDKDVDRRYQSMADLSGDIRRFLNDEPILARPVTAVYQFRKFAKRNRALVGGVLATMLAVLVGGFSFAMQARAARQEAAKSKYEADKAGAINNFITNDFLMKLLAAANSGDSGNRLPVAALVDKSAEQIGVMFANEPLAEAAVRNEIATIYYNLGAFDKAAAQYQMALNKWEAGLGPDHADTLKAVNNLGQTFMHLQRADEAETHLRRALDGRLRLLGEDDSYTLVTMNNLAELYRYSGKTAEAESMLRRTIAIQQRVHGKAHKNTLTTMANLGSLLANKGNIEEALVLHREVFEQSRNTLGMDHVTTLVAGARLGVSLCMAGKAVEAEPLMTSVVSSLERTLGPGHRSTISSRRTLARVYKLLNRPAEAAAQLQIALDSARTAPEKSDKLIREIEKDIRELPAPTPQ